MSAKYLQEKCTRKLHGFVTLGERLGYRQNGKDTGKKLYGQHTDIYGED